jgi:arylformamidase
VSVWRGFDQAALDAEYNLRAAVPDHAAYFARWVAASRAVRETVPCRLDLAYGAGPRRRLDFFPVVSGPAPLLVFLHGGYWQAMDKSDFSLIAPAFTAESIAVAVVGYPLAPAARMGAIVAESRTAIAWLSREAAALGIDGGRIAVAGHSAGGHLAMMALLADWPGLGVARPPRLYAALSGVFDLEPIRLCYLNRVLGLDADEAARNSPAGLLGAAAVPADCRVVLSVGGRETGEFHRQQAEFAARCRDRAIPCTVIDDAHEHHFSLIDRLTEAGSPLQRGLTDAVLAL